MSNKDKYKTQEELTQFVDKYYEHRAKGRGIKTFPDCSYECIKYTIKKLKRYHPELYEKALKADRMCLLFWEKLNLEAASGLDEHGEKHGRFMNSTNIIFSLKNMGYVDDAKDLVTELSINPKMSLAEQLSAVKFAVAKGQIQPTQATTLINAVTHEMSVGKDEKLLNDFEERLTKLEPAHEKLDAKCQK